jgi:predicted nucleotidyltransferase
MRLAEATSRVIKRHVDDFIPGSDYYLFGSRVDDKLKGDDIDLLLLTPEKLSLSRIRALRKRIVRCSIRHCLHS